MGTVVLNHKRRDKEHPYTYTEEGTSVALQATTTTTSAGTEGKEKSSRAIYDLIRQKPTIFPLHAGGIELNP
jgi:hypothetical protein